MTEDFHILIIDDNDALRSALVRELAREGYTIYEAGDGERGLAVFRENDVDLVLLDINLPTIDGFEVLKAAKEEKPSVKVVMVTGYSDLHDALESKKRGADGFVEKPYDLQELITTIERMRSA